MLSYFSDNKATDLDWFTAFFQRNIFAWMYKIEE